MINNSVITRGLTSNRRHRLVTKGYLPPPFPVVEVVRKTIAHGRSALKHAYDRVDEFIVYAKLLSVNSHPPAEKVEGYIKVLYDYTKNYVVRILKVAHGAISSGVNEILIRVKRIK